MHLFAYNAVFFVRFCFQYSFEVLKTILGLAFCLRTSLMEIQLSAADIVRLNQGKKREIHPENNKDVVAKKNRNSGDPYRGRDGKHHPGILPPTGVLL